MDQPQFKEVSFYDFRRLIGTERYKHSFIVYNSIENYWGVLHIGDYEMSILVTDTNNTTPIKRPFNLYEDYSQLMSQCRFFIEPRFLGVSLARIILQHPLRSENGGNSYSINAKNTQFEEFHCRLPLAQRLSLHKTCGNVYVYERDSLEDVIIPAHAIIIAALKAIEPEEAIV